jgi:hypothetical protein
VKLLDRAKALHRLGLLPGVAEKELPALVQRAENEIDVDAHVAPATALLLAADRLLELPTESDALIEEYAAIIEEIEAFCEGAFVLDSMEIVAAEEDDEEEDDAASPRHILVRMWLDGKEYESELSFEEELVDLGFLEQIEQHLVSKGEKRRLCPVVELMDDTARFVFAEPAAVEQAELDEVISAPDFEA